MKESCISFSCFAVFPGPVTTPKAGFPQLCLHIQSYVNDSCREIDEARI